MEERFPVRLVVELKTTTHCGIAENLTIVYLPHLKALPTLNNSMGDPRFQLSINGRAQTISPFRNNRIADNAA